VEEIHSTFFLETKMRTKPFVRLALRRMARKHPERHEEIRSVLRDPDLLDALIAETQACASAELGDVGEGSFLEFFQWLIDNSDQLFEIITKLLVLFSGNEP
jgi:hypothetical protein